MKEKYSFEDFLGIMDTLRSKDGCPWDKAQTHESLRQYLIEEAYEAVDAIDNQDMDNLCEELGDVLLQIVFHAKIESEKNGFTMDDVIDGVSKKMIRRHTHIFSDDVANTPEEVMRTWENNKKAEKGFETDTQAVKNVPRSLPALMRAEKVQKKAADSGFDFENINQTIEKAKEEFQEFSEALFDGKGNVEEEFGDILFSFVNIARFLKINPEFALTNAVEKFINRFEYVENTALRGGKSLSGLTQEELDYYWSQSKRKGY